jgi:hypothetical protein
MKATAYFAPGALGGDADVAAWLAAVASGGTPSNTQIAATTGLVIGLKQNAVWSSLDRLFPHAADNATQALTDLVVRATATAVNSPTFAAGRGFLGNGTSAYIDYAVAMSALTRYTQNASHLGCYIRDGDGTTNMWVGAQDSGTGFSSDARWGSSTTMGFMLQTGGANTSFSQGAQNGHHIVERTDSSNGIVCNNGTDTASQNVGASSSLAASNLTSLARNTSAAYSQFSGSRIAALHVGGALGATKRASLSSLLNQYMTALGANTY